MFKLSLKTVMARKRRLILTAFSVVIGIAFLAGTFVFTDTIQRTFDNLFADVYKNTDAYARSSEEFNLGFGQSSRARIDQSLVGTVQGVEGVTQAEGDVQGSAVIVDGDGDQLGQEQGAPRFGGNIYGGDLSPWRLAEGRLPTGDEMVMDKASFDNGDFAVGDQVTVISQGGPRPFELVGVVRFGDADTAGGATFALFDTPTAESFVGEPGKVDAVLAKGDGSLSQTELAGRIQQAMPQGVEVLTGEQITEDSQSAIKEGLSFFNILLLVFAAVALFVGSFIIYNTFSIIVAQRQREHALLRAIGASRRQVLWSLLLESAVIGLVASIIGIGLGILTAMLLEAMLGAFGIDIPSTGLVLLPRTIIVSLIVGVGITMFSAVMPAVRASKVPPVAAMRDVALDISGSSRSRLLWGAALSVIGIVLLVLGLAGVSPWFLALGIPIIFVGVFVLGPLIARPVASFLGAPLPRWQGVTGTLARENAKRNPKRTARTAAALMVGVALVAGISVLAASIKSSIHDIFEEQFTGDFVVSTQSFGFGGLPLTVAQQLNERPEIEAAAGIQIGLVKVDGKDDVASVVDPVPTGEVFDLGFLAGSLDDLDDTSVAVSESRANRDDLQVGSTVNMQFLDGSTRPLTVSGIYDRDDLAGPYTITKGLYGQIGGDQYDFSVYVLKADGVSDDEARAAIEEVAAPYPFADVQSRSEYIDAQAAQIDSFVNLVYGLLGLSVIIAIVGIANTLSLSVYERTRELGLVRAVGGTRPQVRRTVRWEAVITALLGAVQGIVIGILLGYAVTVALREEGLGRFTLPLIPLLVVLVLAIVVGIVAAITPARRAARVDVLRAVTTE